MTKWVSWECRRIWLWSSPPTFFTKGIMEVHAYIPSSGKGKQKQVGIRDSLASQPGLLGEFQVNERACLEKMWMVLKKWHLRLPFALYLSTHTHTHMLTSTLMYLHTHSHEHACIYIHGNLLILSNAFFQHMVTIGSFPTCFCSYPFIIIETFQTN